MRSHQADEAALAQWAPLINKLAFAAAQRAAGLGLEMDHADFVQEISIVVLRCQDSFDPSKEVKMITFLYRSIYNELNKIFAKEESRRRIDLECEEYIDKDGKPSKRLKNVVGFKVSGDTTWSSEDGDESVWGHIEDESAQPDEVAEDAQLMDFVHRHASDEISSILTILESGSPLITAQLQAYNFGVEADANAGGIRRFQLEMDFSFICKLLGYPPSKTSRLASQVKSIIAQYGN